MEDANWTGESESAPLNVRPSATEVSAQVDRILHAETLKASEPLRKLLEYFGRLYAGDPKISASEHDIATLVFGRGLEFDSRVDSVVRVHAGRLRSKLAEYYMTEGAADNLLLEIPKGRYCLIARERQTNPGATGGHDGALHIRPSVADKPIAASGLKTWVLVAVVGLVAFASGAGIDRLLRWERPPKALRAFWGSFVSRNEPTLVVFSNPRFVGTSRTGLRLFQKGLDSETMINGSYSGTGEVAAVRDLCVTFDAFHSAIAVKRAQLLTWDEVEKRNLIFLGTPAQNLPAGEVRIEGFHFENREPLNAIVNERPAAGEPDAFLTEGAPPYTSDYAIVALTESPRGDHPALVLAGTNTYGTQAAAEFVTREAKVSELLAKLQVRPGQPMPYFVAILKVKLMGETIVQSQVVLLRLTSANQKNRG